MASKTTLLPFLFLVFLLFAFSEGREIDVKGWTVENSGHLTKWSHRHHFQIGDLLKWKSNVDAAVPSVLEVTKEAFDSCEMKNPIKDNVKEVTLDRSGLFYFVSGVKEQCDKGLKIAVKVMSSARRHGAPSPAPAVAQAPNANHIAAEPAPASAKSAAHRGGAYMRFGAIGVAVVVGIALNV